jgi:hypothetical protein
VIFLNSQDRLSQVCARFSRAAGLYAGLVTVFVFICAVGPVTASSDSIGALSRVQAPAQNYRFPDTLSYVYTAEWRLWTAGTATLKMERSGNRQKVSSTADATGVVALLFHVHDVFESSFDPRTFCSDQINKHTEEGFRRRDTNIRFDYSRRKAVLNERNPRTNEAKHAEEDIPTCVTDVLSGIYYLGSLPLQVGAVYNIPVNDGGKTMDVSATVEAREQIKTEAGTFQTVRVRPDVLNGPLKQKGSLWIWYTDDPAHIPVQTRVRAFWGAFTIRLQRIDRRQSASVAAPGQTALQHP